MNIKICTALIALSALLPVSVAAQDDSTAIVTDSATTWHSLLLRRGVFNPEDTAIHYPRLIVLGTRAIKLYKRTFNTFDPDWVSGYDKKFRLTAKLDNWYDTYYGRENDMSLRFHCRPTSTLGLSISAFGLSVGYSIGLDRMRKHAPTGHKFEFSLTTARFMAEFYQMSNSGDMTLTLKQDGIKLPIDHFKGLKRVSWGINASYFFNNRHYSQAAVYGNSRRQLRSAGSLMAGISVAHRRFDINYDDVPDGLLEQLLPSPDVAGDNAATGLSGVETVFDYTDYCLNVGYGYNWVIDRHWLLNATGLFYGGVKHFHSKGDSFAPKNSGVLNAKVRLGITYDLNNFFVGCHGYVDTHFYNSGKTMDYTSNLYDLTVNVGTRF